MADSKNIEDVELLFSSNTARPTDGSRHVNWQQTKLLAKADIRRRLELQGRPVNFFNALAIAIMPGVVTIVCYRIANYLYFRGQRLLPLLIGDLVHLYTRNEVHVGSYIGPGLVLSDRPGIGLPEFCKIGRNCTMMGSVTLTIQSGSTKSTMREIVLGDNCVIGNGTRVVGWISLADGTQTKPNSVVLRSSLVPGAILDGVPARRTAVVPLMDVVSWNPLRPGLGIAP